MKPEKTKTACAKKSCEKIMQKVSISCVNGRALEKMTLHDTSQYYMTLHDT